MRKALDIITIVTSILVLGILGTGFFTYKTVTSEEFQKKLLNKVLDDSLPKMTSPAMPVPMDKIKTPKL